MKRKKPSAGDAATGVTRRGFLTGVGTAVVSSVVLGPTLDTAQATELRAVRLRGAGRHHG